MLYYNILVTAVLFVLMLICFWNLYILRRKNYPAPNVFPSVSVLLPARNEERNIRRVLESLLNQNYPGYEVIVLNDNSEDKTGAIIKSLAVKYPQLKVINGKPLESGWTGKCFACRQLYEASSGEYILFTDADTFHNPDSISSSIAVALNRRADMLTLFPKMQMKGFAEKLIMPLLWFTVMLLLPFYFVDKTGFIKFSIGIGPFMLFKKSAYEAIGTHSSVKNALVEDVWLARKIKENNLRLVVADGRNMLGVRMYNNFSEIWNGFSKNIFAGFGFSSIALFSVNILYVLLFFLPFLLFLKALTLHSWSNPVFLLTVSQVLILYICRAAISAKFSLGVISTILHPIGVIFVPLIALNSWFWIAAGKGAKWKGRTYNPEK